MSAWPNPWSEFDCCLDWIILCKRLWSNPALTTRILPTITWPQLWFCNSDACLIRCKIMEWRPTHCSKTWWKFYGQYVNWSSRRTTAPDIYLEYHILLREHHSQGSFLRIFEFVQRCRPKCGLSIQRLCRHVAATKRKMSDLAQKEKRSQKNRCPHCMPPE